MKKQSFELFTGINCQSEIIDETLGNSKIIDCFFFLEFYQESFRLRDLYSTILVVALICNNIFVEIQQVKLVSFGEIYGIALYSIFFKCCIVFLQCMGISCTAGNVNKIFCIP
eukprot:TRINITY_DN1461_c0_g2_i9.p5 TRINITY_DN1461_c0_g2~~TRINITY_DN1461_c0_g2_i9.p5  ORF type:complete len:113 (-),score=0.83 TRINITY_DN1461_c0_g2_i9:23-361(-)